MSAARKWPCIFLRREIREDVNPRIQRTWREHHVGDPPYGAFQRKWRQLHCAVINPYGSENCAYAARDCVLAYYKTATDAIYEAQTSPVGLFGKMAQRRGIDRADNKPLARDRVEERTFVQKGSGDPGTPPVDLGERQDVPRRPVQSIASLLGSPNGGSLLASPRRREGQEGSER